jgi:hypothetical protein
MLTKMAMFNFRAGIIEFCCLRFMIIFLTTACIVYCYGKSPFTSVSNDLKRKIIIRSILCAIGFAGLSLSIMLLPLTIVMVIMALVTYFSALFSHLQSENPVDFTYFSLFCLSGTWIGLILVTFYQPMNQA